MFTTERERERRQLENEIENLRASLEKSHDQHNKALLLLTDQSEKTNERAGDWEQFQRTIERRLANHEERAEQELKKFKGIAKQKISGLRQELEEEQSKSWFQKLLG